MSTLDLPLDPMTGYESVPDGGGHERDAMDRHEPSLTTLDPHADRFRARPSGDRSRRRHGSGLPRGHSARWGRNDRDPRDRLDAVVEGLPAPLGELVEQALKAVGAALAEPPLDEDLWGPTPDDADVVREAIDAAVTDWRAAEHLRRASVSAVEAAEQLGLSVAALADWTAEREAVAFDHGGRQWFPGWQFEAGIERRQIAQVWQRFPGDAIWFSEWVDAPNPALGGTTPLQWLRQGNLDAVRAAAETITA